MNNNIQALCYIKHRPWDALLMVIWSKIKRDYRTASILWTQLELSKVCTIKKSQLF